MNGESVLLLPGANTWDDPRHEAVVEKAGELLSAGSTGALLWARQIIERLEVFRPDTLEAWYRYFSGGEERDFFALMQTLEMVDDGMKGDGKAGR